MSDNFPLLLPVIELTFGIVFLSVWRFGAAPALWWGVGYLLNCIAFVLSSIPVRRWWRRSAISPSRARSWPMARR